MRDSLATLEALGFPALALAPGTMELLGRNTAASLLFGDPPESPPTAWLGRVHPSDRAHLAEACRVGAARVEIRATSDQLRFRKFQLELRRKGDVTLGLLVETIGSSTGEPALAALVDAIPFDVWARDADGVLIRQNETTLRNWGLRLGGNVDDAGVGRDIADLWRSLNARALAGEVVSYPMSHELNGRTVHYVNLVAPVREGARIVGVIGVNIDVTATHDAQTELARTQSALVKRERLAALGELAAVVAHEVRNPLAAIYNSISALKRMVRLDGDAGILFGILEEEAGRLNRTVGDLLSYVKPLQPARRPDDVAELAREIVRQANVSSAIESSVVAPEHLDALHADPVLLRVALTNLVRNAVQSMPEGGKLTVTVSEVSHAERDAVSIAVHDTGKGIPSDVLSRVFEPFFTTRPSGAGLGLAVVRRIVEAHDGYITAESDPARGTVFTVLLPR